MVADRPAMIEAITIEGLRGIRTGTLEGLGELTILTGPNGCGKSTVLDALLIATHPRPDIGVALAVGRRKAAWNASQWLVANFASAAELRCRTDGDERITHLTAEAEVSYVAHKLLREEHLLEPYGSLYVDVTTSMGQANGSVAFAGDSRYVIPEPDAFGMLKGHARSTRLADPGRPKPIHEEFSAAVRQGHKGIIIDTHRQLVNIDDLDILTEEGTPVLYVVPKVGKAVPVSMSGDGIQAVVQMAVELSSVAVGAVLIEEPEVYQHPRALLQTARAMWATVQRGVQVVITTHSLELIDAIIDAAEANAMQKAVLFNLALDDGALKVSRYSGEQVKLARSDIESDLR